MPEETETRTFETPAASDNIALGLANLRLQGRKPIEVVFGPEETARVLAWKNASIRKMDEEVRISGLIGEEWVTPEWAALKPTLFHVAVRTSPEMTGWAIIHVPKSSKPVKSA